MVGTWVRKLEVKPMKPKLIIVSGYFNPLHKGHIEYFWNSRKEGDMLCVIVNNDKQRALKGSKEFMKQDERLCIISNLRPVDYFLVATDEDRTVCKTLREIATSEWSQKYDLYFANGGDQTNESIPEVKVCHELGITLIDGMGDKVQSSSWLLSED
jgi:cytidyltransferase-like protein